MQLELIVAAYTVSDAGNEWLSINRAFIFGLK